MAHPSGGKKLYPSASMRHKDVSLPFLSKSISFHKSQSNSSRSCSATLGQGSRDSGYVSLEDCSTVSQHQDEPDITATLAAAQQKKPKSPRSSVPSSFRYDINTDKLPMLKFMTEVTQELTMSFKKNETYDWSIFTKVAEKHQLREVIGRQVGLEYVDVFSSLLSRNMEEILTKILAMVGDMDLVSCSKVSKKWQLIIFLDSTVQNRYERAQQALNNVQCSSLTRSAYKHRKKLSIVQRVRSPCIGVSKNVQYSCSSVLLTADSMVSQTAEQHTRFSQYIQVVDGLKQEDSLVPCMHCGSPAKCVPKANRAKCTRDGCQFDFCTKCLVAFHDSKTPCRVVVPQPCLLASKSRPKHLPGSAISKRNIRRL